MNFREKNVEFLLLEEPFSEIPDCNKLRYFHNYIDLANNNGFILQDMISEPAPTFMTATPPASLATLS